MCRCQIYGVLNVDGKTPRDVIVDDFYQTMKNCFFYEHKGDKTHLLNEIGVLRGLAYAMEAVDCCPHNDDFFHFVHIQNEMLEEAQA